MFIDIHSHVYRIRPRISCGTPFCNVEQLLRRNDQLKIEYAVLLPIVSPEIYSPQAVEDILEICEQHPDRFVPYCNLDPRYGENAPYTDLTKTVKEYKALGCKGVGEVMPNLPLNDPKVQNLFYAADQAELPIVYDGSTQLDGDFGLYDDPGLPMLEYTLQDYPKLKIFGHGPVFWSEIARLNTVAERGCHWGRKGFKVRMPKGPVEEEGTVPKLFRKYPNLHGDLSDCTAYNAIARDPEYGPRFLTEFQDRLYFGTDMTAPDMIVELDQLLLSWRQTGKISEEVFRKIAYDNAAKLLDLH